MRTYEQSLAEAEELVKRHTDSVTGLTDWGVYSDIASALVNAYDDGREDEDASWLDKPLSETEKRTIQAVADAEEIARLRAEISEARNEAAVIRRASNYQKQNTHKIRNKRMILRYGLDTSSFEQMLKSQGGCCANLGCNSTEPGGRGTWHIDHDHSTGKIRGLLCCSCNIGLGYFLDDTTKLQGILDYVKNKASNGI